MCAKVRRIRRVVSGKRGRKEYINEGEREREWRGIEDIDSVLSSDFRMDPQQTHLPIGGFPLLMVLMTSPPGHKWCATWTNVPFGQFSWKVAGWEENVGKIMYHLDASFKIYLLNKSIIFFFP